MPEKEWQLYALRLGNGEKKNKKTNDKLEKKEQEFILTYFTHIKHFQFFFNVY